MSSISKSNAGTVVVYKSRQDPAQNPKKVCKTCHMGVDIPQGSTIEDVHSCEDLKVTDEGANDWDSTADGDEIKRPEFIDWSYSKPLAENLDMWDVEEPTYQIPAVDQRTIKSQKSDRPLALDEFMGTHPLSDGIVDALDHDDQLVNESLNQDMQCVAPYVPSSGPRLHYRRIDAASASTNSLSEGDISLFGDPSWPEFGQIMHFSCPPIPSPTLSPRTNVSTVRSQASPFPSTSIVSGGIHRTQSLGKRGDETSVEESRSEGPTEERSKNT